MSSVASAGPQELVGFNLAQPAGLGTGSYFVLVESQLTFCLIVV